jgi:RND family efflux transporter MFP subunit
MKKFQWTGIAVCAAACTSLIAGCGPKETPSKPQAAARTVDAQILTVGQSEAAEGTPVTGTVRAQFETTLASKVMGRVEKVYGREGDGVRQGQLLVGIDSRELQAAVNLAGANYQASVVAVDSAKTSATMEERTSQARIAQAESGVRQAQAQLAAAEARRDLAVAGPRTQEVAQTKIAVVQAESNLKLAKIELDRATQLVNVGAIARRDLDVARNRYELAKGQYDAAVQSESIAKEGSRSQEIRAAEEAVSQARASLEQSRSALAQAKASALQIDVSRKTVDVTYAQVKQADAALRSATVGLSYTKVVAPFDGRIVQRLVDPGAMASPGVPLLAIEGGSYRLEAVVPESLISTVRMGDTSPIELDALPGKILQGRVVEIVPQGDAVSHSFIVKFALEAGSAVKSGMFGRARIRSGTVQRMLIPASSTWEREGLHYVYAVNDQGIARLRIVTLGESIGGQVEVLSGLGTGDRIVLAPISDVADGDKVAAGQP